MAEPKWRTAGWSADPEDASDAVSAAAEALIAAPPDGVSKAWDKLTRAVTAFGQLNPGIPKNTISDFFLSVGKGVVKAQQALDQESLDYLRSQPVMPSVFRVPKASAEISFALSSVAKESWNVLIYGSSSQQSERNEQKVTFDVVAVPPPPELFAGNGGFLTGRGIRSALLERLKQYASVNYPNYAAIEKPKDPAVKQLQRYLGDFDATLIFLGKDAAADVWVLLYPFSDEETPEPGDYNLYVISMSVLPKEPDDDIWLADEAAKLGNARIDALARFLHGLAADQRISSIRSLPARNPSRLDLAAIIHLHRHPSSGDDRPGDRQRS